MVLQVIRSLGNKGFHMLHWSLWDGSRHISLEKPTTPNIYRKWLQQILTPAGSPTSWVSYRTEDPITVSEWKSATLRWICSLVKLYIHTKNIFFSVIITATYCRYDYCPLSKHSTAHTPKCKECAVYPAYITVISPVSAEQKVQAGNHHVSPAASRKPLK